MKRKFRGVLLLAMICSISGVGVGYASWTNENRFVGTISTDQMLFGFTQPDMNDYRQINQNQYQNLFQSQYPEQTQNDYFKVYVGDAKDESGGFIQADVTYDGEFLNISNMPIALSDLKEGNMVFKIFYAIKPTDVEQGIKKTAQILKESDKGYDLGETEFQLGLSNQVWTLESEESTIELEPTKFLGILPETLGKMHGYNSIEAVENQAMVGESNIMQGVVTIEQEEKLEWDVLEVKLSSLEIEEEQIQKILKEGNIHINVSAEYTFKIPLNFNQENAK